MSKVSKLCEVFPGLDCGSCGAPTCRALAEDIVRGIADEKDCIHVLKEYMIKFLTKYRFLTGLKRMISTSKKED